jgi:hypothetical protein
MKYCIYVITVKCVLNFLYSLNKFDFFKIKYVSLSVCDRYRVLIHSYPKEKMTDAIVNFEDIPYFTLVENIAPLLSAKEFGALSMMSAYLRDVFMSNDVWRRLYIQSNLSKFKITDKSVHVGPGVARHKARVPCGELPLPRRQYCWQAPWLNTYPFQDSLRRCSCVPGRSAMDLIPRDAVRRLEIHPFIPGAGLDPDSSARDHFHAAAREYNQRQGHTHSHVCTNIDHYLIDTLDAPKSVRNLKDYRRHTLSKMLTKTKHDSAAKKAATSAARKKKKMIQYHKYMCALKAEIDAEEAITKKNAVLQDALKVALKKKQ